MNAVNIMTTNVVSVAPETEVFDIAAVLMSRHVSAVPVIDLSSQLIGIVSESDLMRRPELGTERHRSWWLAALAGSEHDTAKAFIRSHGRVAKEVMTKEVITVTEDTPVAEIARLLESRRIKRVPVIRGNEVVGIVSRANLVQALASGPATNVSAADDAIKTAIARLPTEHDWMSHGALNATVTDGAVDVWGWATSEDERKAIRLAVERIPGVRSLDVHIGLVAPYLLGT